MCTKRKMKAAIVEKFGDIDLREVPIPVTGEDKHWWR